MRWGHAILAAATLLGLYIGWRTDDSTAAGIFMIAMAVGSTVFTITYAIRGKWLRSSAGRALFVFSLSFALLCVQITLSIWLGTTYPGRGIIRQVLYLVLALALLNLNLTLYRLTPKELQDGSSSKTP